ncbi:MAG TPA: D-aminoacylase [Steroidobacteraceae bacterium]|nr:D-aminoacylase [Steroidobacteraceae bacterium]
MTRRWLIAFLCTLAFACATGDQRSDESYDLILKGGTVYDGSGREPVIADVAVRGDRIVQVGQLRGARAAVTLDVSGRAVTPGFINVLSWSPESLIADGRSQGEIRQGVTLEIFGEGESMGPFNAEMKADALKQQADIHYPIEWTTLAEYLDWLVARGVSTNVASLIGATTVRIHELGYANKAPTPEQLDRMKALVARAMQDGALGVGASLIYVPASFSSTEELIELCKVAAHYGGIYTAHIRSEGQGLLQAIDETVRIARESGIRAEIYHLKASGEMNWPKMAQAVERIEAARHAGVALTADMYPYVAGATGLDAAMPPWVQEGGLDAWVERLKQPEVRARVAQEMRTISPDWESLYEGAGSPARVLFIGFRNPALKPLTGKTLAEVSAMRGKSPEETVMDLVIEDHSRVDTAYFLMSEDNVRLGLRQPWVSIGSDAASMAPEGVFLEKSAHPRAYGAFARFLGYYVREQKLVPLTEAIRRLTRLPAENFRLEHRGCLEAGCFADLVVFDPATIIDHATFEKPHQYATGVQQVFVNGVQVLKDGEHTGARPGRVVHGPGYRGGRMKIPEPPSDPPARAFTR